MEIKNFIELVSLGEIPFFTFLGAFTLYVLNKLHDKQPFSLFKALNINMGPDASVKIVLFDIVLSSILGAAVVIPLTSPNTVPQAIIAGLGMTGVLSVHSKANTNKEDSNG